MYEHCGLDGAQAGRAVEWVMNSLINDLKRKVEECSSSPRSRTKDARQQP
jgi:hypothetical protein